MGERDPLVGVAVEDQHRRRRGRRARRVGGEQRGERFDRRRVGGDERSRHVDLLVEAVGVPCRDELDAGRGQHLAEGGQRLRMRRRQAGDETDAQGAELGLRRGPRRQGSGLARRRTDDGADDRLLRRPLGGQLGRPQGGVPALGEPGDGRRVVADVDAGDLSGSAAGVEHAASLAETDEHRMGTRTTEALVVSRHDDPALVRGVPDRLELGGVVADGGVVVDHDRRRADVGEPCRAVAVEEQLPTAERGDVLGSFDERGDHRGGAGDGLGEVHDPVAVGERRLDRLPAHEIAVLAGGDRVGRLVERSGHQGRTRPGLKAWSPLDPVTVHPQPPSLESSSPRPSPAAQTAIASSWRCPSSRR